METNHKLVSVVQRTDLPLLQMARWFLLEKKLGLMNHQENPLWQMNADGSCTDLEQLTFHVEIRIQQDWKLPEHH